MRKTQTGLLGYLLVSVLLPTTLFAGDEAGSATSVTQGVGEPRPENSYSQTRALGQAKFEVDPDYSIGSYNHTYTLALPPGRNGMEPSLSLNYSSHERREGSIVGFGWKISIPFIERINKNGTDKLYDRTDFLSSLSGELRAIDVVGQAGAYGPDIEPGSFLKYQLSEDNTWTVTDKRGTVFTFGGTAASRQDDPADSARVYRWQLSSIEDRNGNSVSYSYTKTTGQIYPDEIRYTNHQSSPRVFLVEFEYESQLSLRQWHPAFEVLTDKRLDKITISINGTETREYDLTYEQSVENGRSRLTAILETGIGGADTLSLPATTFQYSDSNMAWEFDPVWSASMRYWSTGDVTTAGGPLYGVDTGIRWFDVTDNGTPDQLKMGGRQGDPSYGSSGIYSTDQILQSWSSSPNFPAPTAVVTQYGETLYQNLADFDGDGRIDIFWARDFFFPQWNEGNGIFTYGQSGQLPNLGDANNGNSTYGVRVGDVNGDGLPDVVKNSPGNGINPTNNGIYLNLGDRQGFALDATWSMPRVFWGAACYACGGAEVAGFFLDVNGDGLDDWIGGASENFGSFVVSPKSDILLNRGDGTWFIDPARYAIPPLSSPTTGVFYDTGHRYVDMNGDGIADRVYGLDDPFIEDPGSTVYTYYASSFTDGITNTFPRSTIKRTSGTDFITQDQGVRFVDLNGDGLLDVLKSSYDDPFEVYLNSGTTPDLLTMVQLSTGGTISIDYQQTAAQRTPDGTALAHPDLHVPLQTVIEVRRDSLYGSNEVSGLSFSGGKYNVYSSFDKRFAGFETVSMADSDGNRTITYHHQDNGTNAALGEHDDRRSKIGKPYRVEEYDNQGGLFRVTINRWEHSSLGASREFVYLADTVVMDYDGDSDHRDRATRYTYNPSNGNLTSEVRFGEVTASGDGTFVDLGTDSRTLETDYAENLSDNILEFPERVTTRNHTGDRVAETLFYYDDQALGAVIVGNLTKQEEWVGGIDYVSTLRTYTAFGLVDTETDPRGHTTNYSYDVFDLYPEVTTDPEGLVTTRVHDYSNGEVTETTDSNGFLTGLQYDALDRPKLEFVPDLRSNGTGVFTKTTWRYDPIARSVWQSDIGRDETKETYTYFDGFGRVIQERTEAEAADQYAVTDSGYDDRGNVSVKSLPYFSTGTARTSATSNPELLITYSYDPLDRLATLANVVGVESHAYNQWEETVTDAKGNTKNLLRDAFDNLAGVDEHESGSEYQTRYDYDALDNLTGLTDAEGNVRSFVYDGLSRLLQSEDLHDPSDATFGVLNYEYDAAGNLAVTTDAKDQVVTYTYDKINRVLTEDHAGFGGVEIQYVYDNCINGLGRLCNVATADVESGFEYDPLGNVVVESRSIDGSNFTTGYEYDEQGRLLSLQYPDGTTVEHSYDGALMLNAVSATLQGEESQRVIVSTIDYGPTGQVVRRVFGNGVESTYEFDASELFRLRGINTVRDGDLTNPIQDLGYSYDSVGNITQLAENATIGVSRVVEYSYDDLYRLTAAETAVASSALYTRTYSYSPIGNLATKSDFGVYTYDELDYANPNAVTTIAGVALDYDRNGNVLQYGSQSYSWDYRNRLTGVWEGASTSDYTYDHENQRVGKSVDGSVTYYPNRYFNSGLGGTVRHVFDDAGTVLATIDGEAGGVDPTAIYNDGWAQTWSGNCEGFLSATRAIRGSGSTITCKYLPAEGRNVGPGLASQASDDLRLVLKFPSSSTISPELLVVLSRGTGREIGRVRLGDYTGVGKASRWYEVEIPLTAFGPEALNYKSWRLSLGLSKPAGRGSASGRSAAGRKVLTDSRAVQFVHTDHLGGTNVVTDENGNVVELVDFFPFGEQRIKTGAFTEQRKFTGHEYDVTANLTYARNRYYSQDTGRWLSRDPLARDIALDWRSSAVLRDPQLANFYSYARNNPVRLVDSNGEVAHLPLVAVAAGTGALFGIAGEWVGDVFANRKQGLSGWDAYKPREGFLRRATVRGAEGGITAAAAVAVPGVVSLAAVPAFSLAGDVLSGEARTFEDLNFTKAALKTAGHSIASGVVKGAPDITTPVPKRLLNLIGSDHAKYIIAERLISFIAEQGPPAYLETQESARSIESEGGDED